jgi:hypothetical protein
MYTEKIAKEKCCPVYEISKLLGLNGIIQFQMKGIEVKKHLEEMRKTGGCIASDCMMWRWQIHNNESVNGTGMGYCGLSGKP